MVNTRQSTRQKTADAIKKNPLRKLPRADFQKYSELPPEMQRLVLAKLDGPFRHKARQCSKSMNDLINTIPTVIRTIEFYETFGKTTNRTHAMFMKWLGENPADSMKRPKEWNNRKECDKDGSVAIKTFFNFFSANPATIVEKIDFDTIFVHYEGVEWMRDFVVEAHKRDIKIRAKLINIDVGHATPLLKEFVELFDVNLLKEMRMNVRLAEFITAIRDTAQFKSCESFSMKNRWLQTVPQTFRIDDFFHFAKLDTERVSWTPMDIHRLIQNMRSKEAAKESDRFSMEPGLDEEEVWNLFDFIPAKKVNGTETGITRRFTMHKPELVLEVKITMNAIRGEVFKR